MNIDLRTIPLALPLLCVGCSEDAPQAPVEEQQQAAAAARSDDPRLVALRSALERSNLPLAQQLRDQVGASSDVEYGLLDARLRAATGDFVGASRAIEEARGRAPNDDRVYATAAEIHAAAGRLETADTEIKRGVAACGATPALKRARGVHSICQSGGAEAGLKLLQAAQREDPDLPFLGRPLGQAYLLVGKGHMADGDREQALSAARASLEHDAEDLDARRFLAECCVASGEWGEALGLYEELLNEGEPLEAEVALLYKNAAVAALIRKERDVAVRFFQRARALGLDDAALSTGVTILSAEAQARVDRARAAAQAGEFDEAERLALEAFEFQRDYEPARVELAELHLRRGIEVLNSGDSAGAAEAFRRALEYDPESLQAHNYLGHALYRSADLEAASEAWSFVVDTAQLEKIDLPDPVHITLARAQFESGKLEEAHATLQSYLVLSPTGKFVAETRSVLAALPALEDGAADTNASDG